MKKVLALAAAAACLLATTSVEGLIRSTHRGALNQRLTDAQLHPSYRVKDIEPQWLTQTLDHQDLSGTNTFQQLYYVNDQYFSGPGAPVFFMLGGEGPISPAYLNGHFEITTQAEQYGALLVALEHRFYGQSVPNNDSSTNNLMYLSSSQALEDMVTFHEQIQTQFQLPANTKWIVFGGSYSGALSAWARLKYPHLFAGAFSASAPVEAKLDFFEYFEVTANSLGPKCNSVVQSANEQVAYMIQNNQTSQLQSMFNLCSIPQTAMDIVTFLGDLSGPIANVVQYSNDNNSYQPFNVSVMCDMLENADTPIDGLVAVWNANNAYSNQTACTDPTYQGFLQSMTGNNAGRSWTWQTCQEFGYFQTGESSKQPFSSLISLDSFLQQCSDIFGIQNMTPNTQWINDFYGGNQIVTSRTIFTDGTVDPWHKLATYQTWPDSAQTESILIEGTAHCASLYPARDSDLPGLKAARVRQNVRLAQWLADDSPNVAPEKPSKPSDKKPVKPVQPVKPVKPVQPVKPVKPVKPVQPVKPVKPVKPDGKKPVKPVKPVKPDGKKPHPRPSGPKVAKQ